MIRAILLALLLSAGLLAFYLDEGGGDFVVAQPPAPCQPTEAPRATGTGLTETGQRIALSALAGAACELRVTRERLLLSLTGDAELPRGITAERRTEAFRSSLRRSIDEEVRAGRLDETLAFALRQAVNFLPIEELVQRFLRGG